MYYTHRMPLLCVCSTSVFVCFFVFVCERECMRVCVFVFVCVCVPLSQESQAWAGGRRPTYKTKILNMSVPSYMDYINSL